MKSKKHIVLPFLAIAGLIVVFMLKPQIKVLCAKMRQESKVWGYYHNDSIPVKLHVETLFKFNNPKENPNVTQQCIATDGEHFYVAWPQDMGSKIGVIQQYSFDGILQKSWPNAPINHASNMVYMDNKLYILGTKAYGNNQTLITFDTRKESFDSISYHLPYQAVWEAVCNIGDTLIIAGLNGTGYTYYHQSTSPIAQPDTLTLCYICDREVVKKARIPINYDFLYFTTQGMCSTETDFYLFSSSYSLNESMPMGYSHGMDCVITKLPHESLSPEIMSVPKYIYDKPEGACVKKDEIYSTSVESGGANHLIIK